MRKLTPAERKFIDFVQGFPEGRHMLDKVAKAQSTRVTYSIGCKLLADFTGKDLSAIVTEYIANVKSSAYEAYDKWERIFEDFTIYLEKFGYESASVAAFFAGAKALINSNVPRSMRLQAKGPQVSSRTIPGVTIEDLKFIYNMVDARERAIIGFLKDSGMSRADAATLNIEDLEGFAKGESWVHLNVYRGKEHVEYETFIGPNAVDALKAYFAWREKRGEILGPQSPLLATRNKPYERLTENALSIILDRIEDSTGKVISSHRLRKFFETYMALTVRHPIVLKYWMGHKLRKGRDVEARYIIPPTPEQLNLYKEAYHNIDLTGGSLEEKVKEAAREEAKRTFTEEQKKLLAKAGIQLRQLKDAEPAPPEKDCERIVGESELEGYLQSGWKVVCTLASGRVVISNGVP